MKREWALLCILLSLVLAGACLNEKRPEGTNGGIDEEPQAGAQTDYFRIVSTQPYNKSLCGGTGFHQHENGFDTGLTITLIDEETDLPMDGRIVLTFPDGSGGATNAVNFTTCEEQFNFTTMAVSVSAAGRTPTVLILKPPVNQIAAIQVPLVKSCTSGPTAFENAKALATALSGGNATMQEQLEEETRSQITDLISQQFNLSGEDYSLSCIEADLSRGGFIKAKGTYRQETPFELYYRWGWCSPGGGDCGYRTCFTTGSETLMETAGNAICPKLTSINTTEDLSVPGVYSQIITSDTTNQTREKCLNEGYTKTAGTVKTLSIIQNANRYESYVTEGNPDCMEN
ncbi:MAG: hypothetical protein PHG85_00910 [Candidatus Altiarchaeota archaeon]|nr:hypothetical protein [Candidatus Altiarchaeota archaeon]